MSLYHTLIAHNGLYMKSSRFIRPTFPLGIKILENKQTFNLTLNRYFLYILLAVRSLIRI